MIVATVPWDNFVIEFIALLKCLFCIEGCSIHWPKVNNMFCRSQTKKILAASHGNL